MDESRYQSGATVGGKWGCVASVIATLPIFILLLIVDALGDCAPDIQCGKGVWTHVFLSSTLVAIVVGLGVRWIVNRVRPKDS